jgi:hypothetical protein
MFNFAFASIVKSECIDARTTEWRVTFSEEPGYTAAYVDNGAYTEPESRLLYCYDRQAWIRDGIVEACGHRTRGAVPVCYACTHAGESHGVCAHCH